MIAFDSAKKIAQKLQRVHFRTGGNDAGMDRRRAEQVVVAFLPLIQANTDHVQND